MKKNRIFALIFSVIAMMMLLTPVFAIETRASDQINLYGMNVFTGDGALDIEFTITGKGDVKKIGCESIYLYKEVDNDWQFVTRLTEDYRGMSATDVHSYSNTITIGCNDGVEYKVVVTLFAENSAGRDSRTDVFFVTGQSN